MIEHGWLDLVSSRVGLVTELQPQYRGAEEPVPPFLFTATLAHFDFRLAPRADRLNAGKGRTENEAKLAALGEAVERYCAYHWDPGRIRVASAGQHAITPAECVLYADHQYRQNNFPYRPWSPDTEISWIQGVELPRGNPVDLPAALVYLVQPTPRPEDRMAAVTSNGLAAGQTLARAIVSALYEIIERDALMIGWMNCLPAIRILSPEGGCYAASIIRHYRKFGASVRLFKLATDQLPTVVMAVADDSRLDRPARVIGMGCDVDPVAACDKAVFEMCQARPSEANRFRDHPPQDRLKNYRDVVDLEDHPAFHALRENLHEFDFLSASGAQTSLYDLRQAPVGNDEDTLNAIVSRLVQTGARVAYAEMTTADVACAGFHVVRAIATGLQPIHFGWGEARLGGRRLFEAPMIRGLANAPSTPETLNECPHPLA